MKLTSISGRADSRRLLLSATQPSSICLNIQSNQCMKHQEHQIQGLPVLLRVIRGYLQTLEDAIIHCTPFGGCSAAWLLVLCLSLSLSQQHSEATQIKPSALFSLLFISFKLYHSHRLITVVSGIKSGLGSFSSTRYLRPILKLKINPIPAVVGFYGSPHLIPVNKRSNFHRRKTGEKFR